MGRERRAVLCGESPFSIHVKVSYCWDKSQNSARCEETLEDLVYQMSKDLGGRGSVEDTLGVLPPAKTL